MKTNIGLVKYAHTALNERWGYVWGTFGQKLTPQLYEQKKKQYPKGVGNYETFIKNNWMGKHTADCVGLIKSYVWYDEKTKKLQYNGSQDVTANGMYQLAKKKGHISTMPNISGLCVRFNGHIGIYIGNGEVIEAKGTKYGVVKTKLRNGAWTHWLECPFIEYIDEIVTVTPKPPTTAPEVQPTHPKDKPIPNKTIPTFDITTVNTNINGKKRTVKGMMYKDENYVSIRQLLEILGFTVTWDRGTQTVVANMPTVELHHDNKAMQSQCLFINDKHYVEVRKMLEQLGYEVTWKNNTIFLS